MIKNKILAIAISVLLALTGLAQAESQQLAGTIKICRRPSVEAVIEEITVPSGYRFFQEPDPNPDDVAGSYIEIDTEIHMAKTQKCIEGVRAHLAENSALLFPRTTPLNASGPPFPVPQWAELVATVTTGFNQ